MEEKPRKIQNSNSKSKQNLSSLITLHLELKIVFLTVILSASFMKWDFHTLVILPWIFFSESSPTCIIFLLEFIMKYLKTHEKSIIYMCACIMKEETERDICVSITQLKENNFAHNTWISLFKSQPISPTSMYHVYIKFNSTIPIVV